MDLRAPDIVRDFERTARDAFAREGGIALARAAEVDPTARAAARALLDGLGVDSLDPRSDPDTAFAAARLCRQAGAVVLPYPLVGMLLAKDGDLLAIVDHDTKDPYINHGDISAWRIASQDGTTHELVSAARSPQPLGPFLCRGARGERVRDTPTSDIALWLVFDSFYVLGIVEELLRRSADHLRTRRQFDRPLASFQGLRFRLADLVPAVLGLRELAQYTLWRCFASPESQLVDAIALRVAAIETARAVLDETFQFHGAIGFCSEHDVSMLARHLQPHVRLPWQYEQTTQCLIQAVAGHGFETLYGPVAVSGHAAKEGSR